LMAIPAEKERVNAEVLRYLNRLSDLLFVLGRVHNGDGKDDVLWKPGLRQG
jgi:cob(I)alamin adenosyltransferase